MHKKISRIAGFSLLELGVVLAIVGVMAGGLLVISNQKLEQNKYQSTAAQLDTIEKALAAYAQKGGYLPCPASPSAAPNTATFGTSDNCANAAPTAGNNIVVTGSGTNEEVWIGVIPTRTLSLPDKMMYDAWGNRLRYAVIKKLGSSSTTFESFCSTNTTGGGIQILDGNRVQIPPASTNSVVAYSLVSLGKDREGSYLRNGNTSGVACTGSNNRDENCNSDSVFMDTAYNDGTGTRYFDDMIRWKANYQIINKSSISLLASCSNSSNQAPHLIDAGPFNGCAIDASRRLYCWGQNGYGSLGINVKGSEEVTPVAVGTNGTIYTDWTDVAVGQRTTCGIRSGSQLWCWGRNGVGAVGNGTDGGGYPSNDSQGDAVHTPTPQHIEYTRTGGANDPAAYNDWNNVFGGSFNMCAIRANGRGYCWGRCPGDNSTPCNGDGQNASAQNVYVNKPTELRTDATSSSPNVTFTDWKMLSPASRGGCGLRKNGTVWCWGHNVSGTSGNNTINNPLTENNMHKGVVQVQGGCGTGNWTSVSYTQQTACGICKSGQIYCWGNNTLGTLGSGSDPAYCSNGGCIGASAGDIRTDQVAGPGLPDPPAPYQENYQYNPYTTTTVTVPIANFSLTPSLVNTSITDWVQLSVGNTACGLRANGQIWCWGSKMGSGGTNSPVPVKANSIDDWQQVTVGFGFHNSPNGCGYRKSDKLYYCWGINDVGQLGDGTHTDRDTPAPVSVVNRP